MIWSEEDLYEYPTYPSDNQDAYDIGVQFSQTYNTGYTRDVPIIVSYGLSQPMGLKAGDLVR